MKNSNERLKGHNTKSLKLIQVHIINFLKIKMLKHKSFEEQNVDLL